MMWLIVEAWSCEMGNVVCHNPCCFNLKFFSESISVHFTDEIQRGIAALLPTWPLGLSCVELTAPGLIEATESEAGSSPWVLYGWQSWGALLLYLAIRTAQMWKLAESLDLSLVICCFLHNCPYKIQLETRFLASHSSAVHFAIIIRHRADFQKGV